MFWGRAAQSGRSEGQALKLDGFVMGMGSVWAVSFSGRKPEGAKGAGGVFVSQLPLLYPLVPPQQQPTRRGRIHCACAVARRADRAKDADSLVSMAASPQNAAGVQQTHARVWDCGLGVGHDLWLRRVRGDQRNQS